MKIIGVIGLNGSGKDEVVKYLHLRYGIPLISIGDTVREIASQEGLAPTRENLDNITRRYFAKFGPGYFLKQIAEKIRRHTDLYQSAAISGIRSPQDVRIMQNALGKDFILIRVYISDPHVRYERIRKRGSQRDILTYEEFLKEDRVSEELFHIREAIQMADYTIANDASVEDLHREIDQLYPMIAVFHD